MGGSKDNERKETAAEIAASQVAVKEWNLYNSELKQFEDSFIQRVNNFNTDSNMADVKQAADLSYNREYGKARDATATQLTASGADPSSSKFKAKLSELTRDQAIAQGDTVNRAQVNEQDKYVVGKQDVVAIGAGQKAEGLAGLEDTARLSAQKATNDAYNDFNRRSSNAQAVGTLAGIGTSMYMNRAQPDTTFVSEQSRATSLKDNQIYNPDAMTYKGGR
ncbi:hypothetical protein WM008_01260 [Vibrio vulnificus]|uniref:hypothetical protein n=1 Tax=Vibrio vulnificus TaxID=672 RepID=UPI0030EE1ACA